MRKLLLASASPRRRQLLTQVGLIFDVVTSDYEEDMALVLPPEELVVHLAKGKAAAADRRNEDALIIAADTIVVLDGLVIGKPSCREAACATLRMLSNRTHAVITGVAVLDSSRRKEISRAVATEVTFRELSDDEIAAYVDSGEPLDKAGAYGIQGLGAALVKEIRGDYYNVVGLPLATLTEMLKEIGYERE